MPPPPPPQHHSWPTDNNAVIALVMGCGAFVTSCFPLGIVGLWLGHKARKEATARGEPSNSSNQIMALVGMIVGGIFGIGYGLFWIGYVLIFVVIFGAAALG